MITQARLAELRELAEAATPGPWFVAPEIDGWRAGRPTVVKATVNNPNLIATRRIVTVGQTRRHWDTKAEANVALIAAARMAIPELLDEIERLNRRVYSLLPNFDA